MAHHDVDQDADRKKSELVTISNQFNAY